MRNATRYDSAARASNASSKDMSLVLTRMASQTLTDPFELRVCVPPLGGTATRSWLEVGSVEDGCDAVEGESGEAADHGAVDADELQVRTEEQLESAGRLF